MTFSISAARRLGLAALALQAASGACALDYDEALTLAEQQSPALQAQAAALAGAEAARPAAAALPDPRLSVGIENLPVSGMDRYSLGADFMTMRRIALMQEVPNAAKRAARAEGAQARAERERAVLAFGRLQVRASLARSWLALDFIGRRQQALADLRAENRRLQDTLQARIAAGTAQASELLMARQDALALADRGDDLARDEARARAALKALIGPRAAETLRGQPPLPRLAPARAREQLQAHTELQVYPAQLSEARAALKEAEAEARGDWAWEVGYSRRGAQWGDMVSVQLTFDLPWQKERRQRPLIQARQREAERVQAEQDELLRRHAQQLDEQLAELAALDSQLERLQGEGLPLAEQRVALGLAAYESGRSDLSSVLAARRELLEARLRAIDLDARRSDLRAQLAFLIAVNMNKIRNALAAALLLAAGAAIGWAIARHQAVLPTAAAPAERKPLYWYDPMVPGQKFDRPGKSPFMDMALVPRFADEQGEGGGAGVKISAAAQQSLGLRTATVELKQGLASRIDAVGTLQLNERDVSLVQARAAGFVEKVYARAPGDVIAAGAPLADLLLPDWVAAQREFLAVQALGDAALTRAARQRLTLLGMPEALIAQVAVRGEPQGRTTVRAPSGGLIAELMVREGMTVASGASLARINGLSTLWLEAEVPEAQAGGLSQGQAIEARLAAFPGEVFRGKVAAVLPVASSASRTLRLRVELPNPGGRLRAGMFAQLALNGPAHEALVVPAEAVIRTGRRALVYVVDEPGRFRPVEVETGGELGDQLVILKGLEAGQQLVASAQFLIDSEASLRGIKP